MKQSNITITIITFFITLLTTSSLTCQTFFEHDIGGNQLVANYQGTNACVDEMTSSEEVIAENLLLNKLVTYPNPFSQELIIELDIKQSGIFDVILINTLGEVIVSPVVGKQFIKGKHTILLSPISAKGVLIVQLSNASGIITEKVISQ